MKRILLVLTALVLLVSLVSCGEAQPKTFTAEGMSVTLTDAFTKRSVDGYTVTYDSKDVAVFAIKESFSLFEGYDVTLEEYADLVRQSNASRNPTAVVERDGVLTMEYSFLNESENETYKYLCTMFKGEDAYWVIQFATKENAYDGLFDTLMTYAKSVSFGA
ncbi:MAG: hypothetical protein IJD35_03590 [Clostridia bacterium]|nr:hypothetical protein [Clostridia bacterium]